MADEMNEGQRNNISQNDIRMFILSQFSRLDGNRYELAKQYFLNQIGQQNLINLAVVVSNFVQRNFLADANLHQPG